MFGRWQRAKSKKRSNQRRGSSGGGGQAAGGVITVGIATMHYPYIAHSDLEKITSASN
jgi:hypothetical protein